MAAKGRAMVERRGRRAERKKEARLAVVLGGFMRFGVRGSEE